MSGQSKNTAFQVAGIVALAALLAITLWLQHHSDSRSGAAPQKASTTGEHDHSDPSQHGQDASSQPIGSSDKALQPSGALKSGMRVVGYEAFQYGFAPDPLVVLAGEKVKLLVKSRDVEHGMMIPEIDFSSAMPVDSPKEVIFVAPSEPGRYPIFCSVFCGTGHGSMKGTLVVLSNPRASGGSHDDHEH